MCIGIPMQVESVSPGLALCHGRDCLQRVRTALVGDVSPGDWLLVFIDSAQEIIDARRAAEINATLALLERSLWHSSSHASVPQEAAFDLPSRMSREELLVLSRSTASERGQAT